MQPLREDSVATTTLSMNQLTTYRWSFQEDVENYSQAGFEGIGVWRHKLNDVGPEAALELLDACGLRATHLSWAGGFTGSDGCNLNEAIDDAVEAIQLAAAIQADCLVVHPGGRNNHTFRHAERLLRSALDELLDLAVAADVVLALEPMHAACAGPWTIHTAIEESLALVEEFGSSHLKLVLDAYHFGDDRAVLANLEELAPHLALVHLADRRRPRAIDQDRCRLGAGTIPLAELTTGLIEAGFTGSFDVKLFGPDISPREYRSLLSDSLATCDAWLAQVRGDAS